MSSAMFYAHEIEGVLDTLVCPAKYRYLVVYEPPGRRAPTGPDGRPARIRGEAADLPFDGAWLSDGAGRRYLILSAEHCRRAGVAPGDPVTLRFDVTNPDEAPTPPGLAALLEGDAAAQAAWLALRPGRRRGLAHRIASARTEPTRARRAAETLAGLLTGAPSRRR